jgi:hypothetical protein
MISPRALSVSLTMFLQNDGQGRVEEYPGLLLLDVALADQSIHL